MQIANSYKSKDEKIAFICGRAFALGVAFGLGLSRSKNPALDEHIPEKDLIFRTTKNGKRIAINTATGEKNGLGENQKEDQDSTIKSVEVSKKTSIPKGFSNLQRTSDEIIDITNGSEIHNLNALDPKTPYEQKRALIEYSGSSYWDLNEGLRHDNLIDKGGYYMNLASDIDDVLNKHKTKSPMTLFKGVSSETANKIVKSGKYEDKGFVSTTTTYDIAKMFGEDDSKKINILVFNVPKGTKAASIRNVAENSNEDEILLGRNQKGVVKNIETTKSGRRYIYIDLDSK